MKKKLLSAIMSLVAVFCMVTALCSCAVTNNASIKLDATYYAEYGEQFELPEPVIDGHADSDPEWTVINSQGEHDQTAEAFGTFFPNIGTYTITCKVDDATATASLICRDTKGPKVETVDDSEYVFKGEDLIIPTFVATDISGINDESKSLKIYSDAERQHEVVLQEGATEFTAGEVDAYYFVFTVEDNNGNSTKTVITTTVRTPFVDSSISEGTLFDFDEEGYLNDLVKSSTASTLYPTAVISTDGVADINGGALKLSAAEGNKYYGLKLIKGNAVNSEDYLGIKIRLYATADVKSLTVKPKKDNLSIISLGEFNANGWVELKFSTRQLHPDNIDVDDVEFSFMLAGAGDLYIDEIVGIKKYVDTSLTGNMIASFNNDDYMRNVEQIGFDIGNGSVSAEYAIVGEDGLPEDAKQGVSGKALKVVVNDVWSNDYAGYGWLGDGFKYYLPERIDMEDMQYGGSFVFRIYSASGTAMALSFNYVNPVNGNILRSKARWVTVTEGSWTDVVIDYTKVHEIVPYAPISRASGGVYENFELVSVNLSTCSNNPIDREDEKKGFKVPCTEFYVDSISYNDPVILEWEGAVVTQGSKLPWMTTVQDPNGKAVVRLYDAANYEKGVEGKEPLVKNYAWINDARISTLNTYKGVLAEAMFRTGHFDSVRVTFPTPLTITDKGYVKFIMYSNLGGASTNGDYMFTFVSSDGRTSSFRIIETDNTNTAVTPYAKYNCYTWSTLKFKIADLLNPNSEPLSDIAYVEIAYTGRDADSYLYLQPVEICDADPVWKGATIEQSTTIIDAGTTNGGAVLNVLPYADRDTKSIIGGTTYSGGGARETNFKAGLEDGDVILEMLTRHNNSASQYYNDGVKITYDTALDYTGKDILSIKFYLAGITYSGHKVIVRDEKGHANTYTIAKKATSYAWYEEKLSVSALSGAGVASIKSIEIITYGITSDGAKVMYTGIKSIDLLEKEPELITWNGATVSQSTYTWAGKQSGQANINVLAYADVDTKNLLGDYPYSGGTPEKKLTNFKAGLASGDVVLEVTSRMNAAGDYNDGAKLTYETALSFGDNDKLRVVLYVADITYSGYVWNIIDSDGTSYQWRLAASEFDTAYAWYTKEISVADLKTNNIDDIKSIEFVAVGGVLDTAKTRVYTAYKSLEFVKDAPVDPWAGITFSQNVNTAWAGNSTGNATINKYDTTGAIAPLVASYQYINETRLNELKSYQGEVLEVKATVGTSDGARITPATPIDLTGKTTISFNIYTNASGKAGDWYVYFVSNDGTTRLCRVIASDKTGVSVNDKVKAVKTYTIYTWSTITVDISDLGITDLKAIDFAYCNETITGTGAGAYLYVQPIVIA